LSRPQARQNAQPPPKYQRDEHENWLTERMSILGVRIELFVNDVEHSARFYREVLGFRPERDVDETGYLAISSGALTIGLQGHAKLPSGHHFRREHFGGPRGVGVEIQIEVDDVDALYARAVTTAPALGAGIEPIGDRSWGLRDFRLIDPDGYYLCISSPQA
jgi:lactoylglutathione lyase